MDRVTVQKCPNLGDAALLEEDSPFGSLQVEGNPLFWNFEMIGDGLLLVYDVTHSLYEE